MEHPSFQHRHRCCMRMREMCAAALLARRTPIFIRNRGAVRRFTPLESQNSWRGENQCETLRG